MRDVPIHYLRANERQWAPKTVAVLDTETRVIQEDPEILAMRLWHMRLADRKRIKGKDAQEYEADGRTAPEVAEQIERWFKGRQSIWLYCHNTNFDLATTRLPIMLCARGWHVTDMAIDSRAPWMRLSRGRRTLTICDSHTWLPTNLQAVGQSMGMVKPALPDDDDDQVWLARCKADTDITLRAMLTLMNYWDDYGLGNWSVTGAASGWNCMRHMPSKWKVVIDPNPDRCEFDRKAIYGGRRSVWKAGQLKPGRYVEADFERAYTVIAATMPLPVKPGYTFTSLSIHDRLVDNPWWGIIAECEIRTDEPLYPVRHNGRVWYPVGHFTTCLAGPDIAEARKNGHLVSIGKGWTHQLGYMMQPWAQWCLAQQAEPDSVTPPVVKMWLKHTGRTVIGKWAQRRYTRTKIGMATTFGWGYEDAWVNSSNAKGSILDIGGDKFLSVAEGEGENSYPAILAWVESYVRVRIGRAITAIGAGNAVQCDTDGLICDSAALTTAILESKDLHPLRLRIKTAYRQVQVIGPQHMTLDGKRRWSGIPARAEPDGKGGYVAQVWPGLPWQIKHGDRRGYVLPQQTYTVAATYAPGWVALDGSVLPVEMRTDTAGRNRMVPWRQSRYGRCGATLAAGQNDILGRLNERRRQERGGQDQATDPPGQACRHVGGTESTPEDMLAVP
jgi:hypothetical protein